MAAAAAPAQRGANAAKGKAAAAKPKPAAARRRSARSLDGKEVAAKLATKVTAFFQAPAHTSGKKQAAAAERKVAASKAAAADCRPRAGNRLGMRARK